MHHKCPPVLVCKFLIPCQNPRRYVKALEINALVCLGLAPQHCILPHSNSPLFANVCGNPVKHKPQSQRSVRHRKETSDGRRGKEKVVGAGAKGAWELQRGNDNVRRKSIVLKVPRRKKEPSHKNGKWAPEVQSIRCQADRALKNEAIITGVHLTESRWKSHHMMSALMHNQENSTWVMYC